MTKTKKRQSSQLLSPGSNKQQINHEFCSIPDFSSEKKAWSLGWCHIMIPVLPEDVLHFTWINFPLVVQASDTASSYLQAKCLRVCGGSDGKTTTVTVDKNALITPYYTLEIHMEPKDGGLKKMIFLTTTLTWKFAPSFPGHALYLFITFNPQGLITRAQEQCWQQAIFFFLRASWCSLGSAYPRFNPSIDTDLDMMTNHLSRGKKMQH